MSIPKRCKGPFWLVVAVPITSALLIACTISFGLENVEQGRLRVTINNLFSTSEARQAELTHEMVENNTALHHSALLRNIHNEVTQFVVEDPDEAVDALWTHMKTRQRFFGTPTGSAATSREEIGYAMWGELRDERRLNHSRGLIAVFRTGALSAVLQDSLEDGRPSHLWYEGAAGDLGGGRARLNRWSLDEHGNPSGAPESAIARDLSISDIYAVQARLAEGSPDGVPVQAWSPICELHGQDSMVAWTLPIAHCGNYSCFEGVVASWVTLKSLKQWCDGAWQGLAASLATSDYAFRIDPNGSSVFVVQQSGRDPAQVGLLISASGVFSSRLSELTPATESPQPMVSHTAKALLQHYGGWSATALLSQPPPFAYRVTMNGSIETLADESYGPLSQGCQEVATLSMELDDKTRWLLVLVLPVGAFTGPLGETERSVRQQVAAAQYKRGSSFQAMRFMNFALFLVMVFCSFALGAGLSAWVSQDLRSLSGHMRQLSKLDFSTESEEFKQLLCGKRSRISDVCELQGAFCRLAQSVHTFGRFVPESVVRNIVRGNQKALRLHVSWREVTVMFSDIRDFNEISEKLSQTDLLFVLMRYLTVMTQLIEHFGGVVTEILGDSVLAFWNTPENVEDHATKACAAALAQQHALVSLNQDLAALSLPRLAIRIGLHTGKALSGNLGSATKMKFGCMGDTVNLASRLEGLCKHYDVGIMCSGTTRAAVRGIVCRDLNLVQVKGKIEPTLVCEVIGRDAEVAPGEPPQAVAGALQQRGARLYEEALAAFHLADFVKACTLVEQILNELPQDKAATKLLHLAWSYVAPDGDVFFSVLTEEQRAAWTGVVVMTGK